MCLQISDISSGAIFSRDYEMLPQSTTSNQPRNQLFSVFIKLQFFFHIPIFSNLIKFKISKNLDIIQKMIFFTSWFLNTLKRLHLFYILSTSSNLFNKLPGLPKCPNSSESWQRSRTGWKRRSDSILQQSLCSSTSGLRETIQCN